MSVDFGFTGHYFHQPSGLNLAMYRAYNPTLGRWISRDPIAERGGFDLYAYASNDPVDHWDPFGKCCKSTGGNSTGRWILDHFHYIENDYIWRGLDLARKRLLNVVCRCTCTGELKEVDALYQTWGLFGNFNTEAPPGGMDFTPFESGSKGLGQAAGNLADVLKDVWDAYHGPSNPVADVLGNGQTYCDQIASKCE